MLCLALLLAALPVILPVFTSATAADDQEEQLLGTLSQRFEASGPGVISSGSGDAGGKSYGAYQFSSRSDIPRAFFRWCQSSSDTYYRSIGNRLAAAYEADGGYGSSFDATWRALANEDSDGFMRVQRNYVRRSYYDPIVRSITFTSRISVRLFICAGDSSSSQTIPVASSSHKSSRISSILPFPT